MSDTDKRAFNGPGNLGPRRNEAGLAPGLERVIEEAANDIDVLVATLHQGRGDRGHWSKCWHECAAYRAVSEHLRDGLFEWTGKRTESRVG